MPDDDPRQPEPKPTRVPEPPEWEYTRPEFTRKHRETKPGDYHAAGIGFAAAYMLVGSVIGGWFVGWLIDRASGGNLGQGLGVLFGGILGTIAVLIMLIRGGSRG